MWLWRKPCVREKTRTLYAASGFGVIFVGDTNGRCVGVGAGSVAVVMALIECVPSAAIVFVKPIVYQTELPAASLTQAR